MNMHVKSNPTHNRKPKSKKGPKRFSKEFVYAVGAIIVILLVIICLIVIYYTHH